MVISRGVIVRPCCEATIGVDAALPETELGEPAPVLAPPPSSVPLPPPEGEFSESDVTGLLTFRPAPSILTE